MRDVKKTAIRGAQIGGGVGAAFGILDPKGFNFVGGVSGGAVGAGIGAGVGALSATVHNKHENGDYHEIFHRAKNALGAHQF